jgi:hypothetical protein
LKTRVPQCGRVLIEFFFNLFEELLNAVEEYTASRQDNGWRVDYPRYGVENTVPNYTGNDWTTWIKLLDYRIKTYTHPAQCSALMTPPILIGWCAARSSPC